MEGEKIESFQTDITRVPTQNPPPHSPPATDQPPRNFVKHSSHSSTFMKDHRHSNQVHWPRQPKHPKMNNPEMPIQYLTIKCEFTFKNPNFR